MPFGLFLLIGFSLIVFRRAKAAGRHPWAWTLTLWLLVFGMGFLGSTAGIMLALIDSNDGLTDSEMQSAARPPAILGMMAGAIMAIWGSGRLPVRTSEPSVVPDSSHR